MRERARNWLTPAAWCAAVAAILLLLFPLGFPNYDTIYALVWGREMAHGAAPDYSAALPPTPHPLAELFGLLTTPLGGGAIGATMVVAYLALGLTAYFVYRLGSEWFDRPIGLLAALIVMTRAPFLSNGLRAYVDLPYIVLCLAALLVESRRPRAGWPVLALLVPAGLLRPEAWLFSFAYLAYLAVELRPTGRKSNSESRSRPIDAGVSPTGRKSNSESHFRPVGVGGRMWTVGWRRERSARELAGLAALALAGPLAWATFDWITAGSPTYSFTGTRETVETLERKTGPVDLVLYGPRALGEVLQWPGVVGALGGILLCLGLLRRRSGVGIAASALALGAFAVLACAGLAIIARYTMLAAAVLSVFVAAALLGWRQLGRGDPWRRPWMAFAAVVALMFVIWAPNQWNLDSTVHRDLANQGRIEGDLSDLAGSGAFRPLCLPISVPNHRAVPRLAFDLEIEPSRVVSVSEQNGQPRRGYFLDPSGPFVVHNFILDPNDPSRLATPVPRGFRRVARNQSWILYRRC